MARDFESLIVDPSLVDPSIDTSNLRTTTDTREELLAATPEFTGIQFDPTNINYLDDLYALYSGQLPMIPVTPAATTPDVGSTTDEGGGGGGTPATGSGGQATGGNTEFEQSLIDQGVGVQIAPGQPVVAPGEIPVTQAEIDAFNAIPVTQPTTGGITTDPISVGIPDNESGFVDPLGTIGGAPGIFDINQTGDPALNPGSTMAGEPTSGFLASGAAGGANLPSLAGVKVQGGLSTTDAERLAGYTPSTSLEAEDVDAQGNLLQTGIDKIKSINSNFDPVSAAAKLAFNTYVGKPVSFVVDALQALPKSKSQKEYEGYTDAQKGVIDEAYGAGGVMEGYNAVSTFGDGPLDTMTDRYNTRVSNGIIDATTTDLANKINALGGNVENFEDGNDRGDDRDSFGGVPGVPDAIGGNISKGYSYADTPGGGKDASGGDFGGDTGVGQDAGTSGGTGGRRGGAGNFGGAATDDFADDFDDGTMTGAAATTTGGDPVGGFFDAVDKAAADARSDAMGGDNTGFSGDTGVGQDAGTSGGTGGRRGGAGGNGDRGGGKIVCTMMNESYGFGSFRNKIWMKFHKDLSPEYQRGYHKLFLPLVKIAKKNMVVKKILEHIAVHSTIDMRQSMRGKTHLLGRIYRKILLPLCYWVGKNG